MKSRFTSLDIVSIIAEIFPRLHHLRVINVYDINNKTYLIKFGGADQKAVLLLESGIRFHCTDFTWPKNMAPSAFSMKMRKHLRSRRLESIRQLGIDRIVDMQFGSGEAAYHVILELYDRGNIVLTDFEYTILNILRPRTDDSQDVKFVVREKYPIESARQNVGMLSDKRLSNILTEAKEFDNLKRVLNPHLSYGIALISHSLIECGIPDNARIGKDFLLETDLPKLMKALTLCEELMSKCSSSTSQGFILQNKEAKVNVRADESKELLTYTEFNPLLFNQHKSLDYMQVDSFNQAVDEYFSKQGIQKVDMKILQQEKSAIKKLENVKKDHERRLEELVSEQEKDKQKAYLIEANLTLVDQAISVIRNAIANQIDWNEINSLIKEAKSQNDPVASSIKSLKLNTNQMTLLLSEPSYAVEESSDDDLSLIQNKQNTKGQGTKIDIDLSLSAYANARRYYDLKRLAANKQQKTIDSSMKALKSAEKKTKKTLQEVKTIANIVKARKTYWFEKFFWFISSENYLVIGGRDMQQNELLVKRHLRPNDIYVHADLHGASSVIIKNPRGGDVPPKTLNEAGCMSVCYSAAWDAKVVSSAWWVTHSQVSKTAPTGEYLTAGSFMIRGKKNFLTDSHLIYGFGFLFKLDDLSVHNHINERKYRGLDEIDNSAIKQNDIQSSENCKKYPQHEENVFKDKDSAVNVEKPDMETVQSSQQVEEEMEDLSSDIGDDQDEQSSTDEESKNCSLSEQPDESNSPVQSPTSPNVISESATDSNSEQADSLNIAVELDNISLNDQSLDNEKTENQKNCEVFHGNTHDSSDENQKTEFPDTSISLKLGQGNKYVLQPNIKLIDPEKDNERIKNDSSIEVKSHARLSAKQKRDLRKGKSLTDSQTEINDLLVVKSKNNKPPKTSGENQTQNSVPLKRGQKAKLKKIQQKYKDQDEEERQLRMQLLAPDGPKKEVKKKLSKSKQKQQQMVSQKKQFYNKTLADISTTTLSDNNSNINPGSQKNIIKENKDAKKLSNEDLTLDDEDNELDDVSILDTLTGQPLDDDTLLFAIPVCAPYSCLTNYKYKVKLTPGNTKRGKATKNCLYMFQQDKMSNQREKDLLKSTKDVDLSRNIPGKVKVSIPANLTFHKQRKK